MAYIDPYTGQEVLTLEEQEEKRKRERELANTAVQTEERKVYADGTQEIITKQEITPEAQGIKAQPTVFENLGNALAAMPENFVRNVQQAGQNFATNLQAAPANFAANVQGAINPNQPAAQPTPQPTPAPKLNFDVNAYNSSIAQQESGNRADIGFHDRTKSSAFGLFGITAPAYADARRADPSLPADITQANKEQQTRAQNIITNNNARFLQQRGIETTPGVLSAAHFAGPSGLHKFLTQTDDQGRPYISPQAQAANGGYDKAAAIINARLNGQAMPASGATSRPPQAQPQEGVAVATGQGVEGTQTIMGPVSPEQVQQQAQNEMQALQQYAQPQAASAYSLATGAGAPGLRVPGMAMPAQTPQIDQTQTAIARYQTVQDNPMELMKLHSDDTQPAYLRQRAGERVADMLTQQRNLKIAEETLPTLGQNELAKIATKKSEGNSVGDWLQYLLFKHVGLNDLANQKGEQLGIGHTWQNATVTDEEGNDRAVEILTTANGRVLQGNFAGSNERLSRNLLEQASGGILGKGVHVSKVETRINPNSGEVVSVQTLSDGKQKFKLGGKPYAGDTAVLIPEAQYTKQEDTRVNAGYSNLSKLTSQPTQQQKFDALRMAGVTPKRIEQELGLQPGTLTNQLPGGQAQAAGQPVGAGNATNYIPPKTQAIAQNPAEEPVQRPGEPDSVFKARLKTWEGKNKLQQKDAEAFVSKATDVRSTLNKFKDGIDVINSGVHNLGPNFTLSGAGPLPRVQQFFGEQFGTNGADNTKLLRSLITRGGLEGIKNYMGPAISNFDVETWMKNNPISETSTPQAINAWLTKTHNAMLDAAEMQRKNAINMGMLEPGFTLGSKIGEPGAANANSGTTSSGNKYKKVQ